MLWAPPVDGCPTVQSSPATTAVAGRNIMETTLLLYIVNDTEVCSS